MFFGINALKVNGSKSDVSGGNTRHLLYLSYILILLSSDTELNPGPATPKYPCQTCNKAVTWRQRAVACDNCNLWYHANCALKVNGSKSDVSVMWKL
jgi:hypothetical protein